LNPAAFSRVSLPVAMMPCECDPRMRQLILVSFQAHIPQLELLRLERCGQKHWHDRAIGKEFYWLLQWFYVGIPRRISSRSTPIPLYF